MKKILFALLAVMFAIALIATCDLFEPPTVVVNNEVPKFTPDGRPMVVVTLDIGNLGINTSRALTLLDAQSNVRDFEVVFLDTVSTGTFYGTIWTWTGVGTSSVQITIPVDDYSDLSRAAVFAGTRDTADASGNNRTLLAVGRLTEVDGVSGTNILETSNNVTFTLTALKGSVGDTTSTAFSVYGPGAGTHGSISGVSSYQIAYVGSPYYDDPAVPTTGGTTSVGQFSFNWDGGSVNSAGVYITGAFNVHSTVATELVSGTIKTAVFSIGSKATNYTYPGTMSATPEFRFNIKPPDLADGNDVISKIYMEVPVKPIGNAGTPSTYTRAFDWYIKGGRSNATFDASSTVLGTSSTAGGAVLLRSIEDTTGKTTIDVIVPTSGTN